MKILKEQVIKPAYHFGHIDRFFNEVVKPSGYEYFEWNGRVFKVNKRPYESTDILYKDL